MFSFRPRPGVCSTQTRARITPNAADSLAVPGPRTSYRVRGPCSPESASAVRHQACRSALILGMPLDGDVGRRALGRGGLPQAPPARAPSFLVSKNPGRYSDRGAESPPTVATRLGREGVIGAHPNSKPGVASGREPAPGHDGGRGNGRPGAGCRRHILQHRPRLSEIVMSDLAGVGPAVHGG